MHIHVCRTDATNPNEFWSGAVHVTCNVAMHRYRYHYRYHTVDIDILLPRFGLIAEFVAVPRFVPVPSAEYPNRRNSKAKKGCSKCKYE